MSSVRTELKEGLQIHEGDCDVGELHACNADADRYIRQVIGS
jgi:hypothetical protein